MLKVFRWPLGITVATLLASLLLGGPQALVLVAILAVLEISLSFDNAVVNAGVLGRMNDWWQKIFLSVGIIIAVFGMRLIFPIVIVAITAHIGPIETVHLALDKPSEYAELLHGAHPAIAAFGGLFLLMIFLDFVFEEHGPPWLGKLEAALARIGKLDQLAVVIALTALAVVAETIAKDHQYTVIFAGVLGVVLYIFVGSLGDLFEEATEEEGQPSGPNAVALAGKAAFFLFIYLEILDASFSFDGVIGAFAITENIFVIAAGLGVGALYIRGLTVYLVKKGTLSEYVFLEHGAHWAIGALAVILLLTIKYEIPEVVTGVIGVAFIGIAMVSSVAYRRKHALTDQDAPENEDHPHDPRPGESLVG